MDERNPLFLIDFYKVGHVQQYPEGVERIWVNWTPRYSHRDDGAMVHFGLHYFIQKYLIHGFNEHFFWRPLSEILRDYRDLISSTLGIQNPKTDHIESLHRYSRLPIEIYSLPEGSLVPLGVPAVVITNTDEDAFWLPNYLETMFSNILWKPSTSATTARSFRQLFTYWAKRYGHTNFDFINWQGHDFSFRGMSGIEDACLSGMGHLTSFFGTDTIPAIIAARNYYGADLTCGGSVPATEHSVMCAGGKAGEFETFKRLITEVYPSGIVSIVSDTWDLWKVLTDYVPRLRDTILKRDGKVVIRPDSGDPVKIMIGDPDSTFGPERAGVLGLLAEVMGVDDHGSINKAAAIYGDGISLDRANRILQGCVETHKLSPYNCVFGIGSYTYQFVTRDTYGLAMKATAVQHYDNVIPIYKSPVTDDGGKKSLCGIPIVHQDETRGFYVTETDKPGELLSCALKPVMMDGYPVHTETLGNVRRRIQEEL